MTQEEKNVVTRFLDAAWSELEYASPEFQKAEEELRELIGWTFDDYLKRHQNERSFLL